MKHPYAPEGLTPYVAGFMFSTPTFVALIRKRRPSWQAGRYNAIGGKVELYETPAEAMVREFKEETSYESSLDDWRLFCRLTHPHRGGYVYFFVASFDKAKGVVQQTTDELVDWIHIPTLFDGVAREKMIPNLRWLIPMAIDPSCVVADVQDNSSL